MSCPTEHVRSRPEYESWSRAGPPSAAPRTPASCSDSRHRDGLKAYEIFGDAMYQGYGQTELLPVAMLEPPQWFAKDVPGSQPPHAELQISDENNRQPSASSMAE